METLTTSPHLVNAKNTKEEEDEIILKKRENFIILTKPIPPLDPNKINKHFNLFCGGRLRFTLIFPIVSLMIFSLPFFIPLLGTFFLNLFYSAQMIIVLLMATLTYYKITCNLSSPSKEENYQQNTNEIKLILMTFVYKEPIDLVEGTLNNLLNQTYSIIILF